MTDVTVRYKKLIEKFVGVGKEVDLWLGNEQEMLTLGKKWLKDDEFHEVVSFPLEENRPGADGVLRLGDVVVWEKSEKIEFLLAHGIKHLMGQHHD